LILGLLEKLATNPKKSRIQNLNAKSKNFKNYANPIYYPPPPATIATTATTTATTATEP
jgi:hypothetical protein